MDGLTWPGSGRFNEALACPPGKPGCSAGNRARPSRFNEAPACPPGKGARAPGRVRVELTHFNEAPACPPGKRVGSALPGRPSADRASMRPRRVRRGNRHPHPRPVRGLLASMRPRRVRRGNPDAPNPPERRAVSFNEAPACPPGKPHGPRLGPPSHPRFNEAPACPPGKCASTNGSGFSVWPLQ